MRLFSRQPKTHSAAALKMTDELEANGRTLDAIEVLTEANRQHPDPEIERRLLAVRHRAFDDLAEAVSIPPSRSQRSVAASLDAEGVPSIAAAELTADLIRESISTHGCLIARGLVDRERVQHLVRGIDRAFDGHDAYVTGASPGDTTPWYDPFEAREEDHATLALGRQFISKGGGVWIADSPRLLFGLLDTFEEVGLRATITDYLGERPAISVNKGTLRRVRPAGGTEWWHQDGAFLGEGIKSLNVWLSLSHCGRDAPGMDVVLKRINHIVPVGTGGADFDWSVSEEVVEEVADGTVTRPIFGPGDALLFDHLCLHRTGTDPGMTETRYAIETWFFAPSAYPDPHQQLPLVF